MSNKTKILDFLDHNSWFVAPYNVGQNIIALLHCRTPASFLVISEFISSNKIWSGKELLKLVKNSEEIRGVNWCVGGEGGGMTMNKIKYVRNLKN